jgi:flagellar biosynthetic protein FliR
LVKVGGNYLNVLELILNQFDLYLLVLVRISGLFVFAPIFNSRNLPMQIKLGLSALIAFIVLPILPVQYNHVESFWIFVFGLIGELIVGFLMGFVVSLILAAVQTAGELIDMQIGFSMVNIFDPQSGNQIPLLGNFKYLLALLLFLTFNGHHYLLYAMVNSFYKVPLLSFTYNQAIVSYMIQLFANSFVIAVQVAMPVIGTLFLTELAFGIIVRTVPQMNVFMVGIPVKIILGIIVLSLSMPLYVYFLKYIFEKIYDDIFILFSLM